MRKISLVRGRSKGKGIGPIDTHVGARLRQRRTLLGMSQTTLGDALGVSFQQVQKYERGTNRMGSSRLFDLSRVLDVPVEHFFEDMAPEVAASSRFLLPCSRPYLSRRPIGRATRRRPQTG